MAQKTLTFILFIAAISFFRIANAQLTAPSKGGEVNLVLATSTTMELRFGMTGTGQGRVIAMAVSVGGMPIPLAANNGTTYVASATFGQGAVLNQGYVVYCGTGHSATVTGLTPNTYYYIASSEYNKDSTTILYNTRGSSITTSTRAGSPTALATSAQEGHAVTIYPNPCTGQVLNVSLQGCKSESFSLRLVSMLGQLLLSQIVMPTGMDYTLPLNLPNGTAAGTYLLTLSNSTTLIQQRVTVLN